MIDSFVRLKKYCEREGFKGWDPYDGLNSKLFQKIPILKRFALCRLIVIQGFKRCPFNLRPLAMVPKEYNAKGIGLFLSGYCNLYRAVVNKPLLAKKLGSLAELKKQINELAEILIDLRSKHDYHGACWGYNFDWQARRLFLFPKFTPTIVATTFCATALIDAYEVTKDKRYLDIALTSAEFVVNDLHRTPYKNGFLFSYSPLQGNDTVFNASLLGSKLLSYCYKYTKNEQYLRLAEKSVDACCDGQDKDGSWVYGMLPVQSWIDSFHTGYNLEALTAFKDNTGIDKYDLFLEKGFHYYIHNFFESDGTPKYYNNRIFPIDIHCPAELIITLSRLNKINDHVDLVNRVLNWTLSNMQDKRGYFYYQIKKHINSKIPYMRWSNAFMFNALSHYIVSIDYNNG